MTHSGIQASGLLTGNILVNSIMQMQFFKAQIKICDLMNTKSPVGISMTKVYAANAD